MEVRSNADNKFRYTSTSFLELAACPDFICLSRIWKFIFSADGRLWRGARNLQKLNLKLFLPRQLSLSKRILSSGGRGITGVSYIPRYKMERRRARARAHADMRDGSGILVNKHN